jgi:hypothetical protein
MTSLPASPVRTALAAALLAALPGAAHAVQIDYQVGVSALHSDNIALSDGNKIDETVVSPQLRFDITQTGSTLSLGAHGQLQYLDYRDNTFDDGFRGSFSGQGLWTMIPERLDWTFEDYLSRQPIDTLASFSPGNEQQANLFVTGPTLYVRMGQSTRGQLDLRYSNSYAGDNDAFNSDRYNAAARVLRDLSTTRTIGVNVEATRVEFDLDALDADYTRYDGYLSYTSRFRSLDLDVSLGYSRLEFRDRPNLDDWLPLARADLAWHISPRSTLDAALSYEFSDAAENLAFTNAEDPVLDDLGNPTVPVTPEVFRQRRLELGYAFSGERLGFEVRPYYQRISYVDSLAEDEEIHGGYAQLSYKVRPRMTLSLLAAHEDRKFSGLDRHDRDFSVGVSLENRFTRNWSARFDLQRRQRNSSETGQDYDENAAIVSFSYRR